MSDIHQSIAAPLSGARPSEQDRAAARIWAVRIALICAFGGGLLLRIWQLNIQGYNTDEAVYAGQAAAIAGVPVLRDLFPIFRAHPLLFQFFLSCLYRFGFSDLWGRLAAVGVGLVTVWVTYKTGRLLYGELAGAVAAVLMAFMPYHVLVSRQVLLDGPETLFATLTLYTLALWGVNEGRRTWLYASGVVLGLTFLSKETGIVLLGSIYAFVALASEIRVRIADLLVATLLFALVIAPFPLTVLLAGGSGAGRNYLVWQLFRRANHEWSFYPMTVTPMIGLGVVAVALVGLLLLRRERSWNEKLLLSWILVPLVFFQLWPTKGFQYLLPIAPAVAILAGRVVGRWVLPALRLARRSFSLQWVPAVLGIALAVSLWIPSWKLVQPSTSAIFLAGTGGVPGGREAGAWVAANVPADSVMMTVGPSMANIIEFYGRRKAYGLSVSPNPLFRNPSYTPLDNPDLLLRKAQIQYIIWDSYSAQRTPFFADKLMGYVSKYHGRVTHVQSVLVVNSDGKAVATPVIVIYEVRP